MWILEEHSLTFPPDDVDSMKYLALTLPATDVTAHGWLLCRGLLPPTQINIRYVTTRGRSISRSVALWWRYTQLLMKMTAMYWALIY